jgi:thioredoxin-related protein
MPSALFRAQRMNRRHALRVTSSLALAAWTGSADAGETSLPRPKSLATAARQAQAAGGPLVLLVSLQGCPYCELVRRNYLQPMREQEALATWQIDVRDKTAIEGFDGLPTTPMALTRLWAVKVTPTVFFLDAQGREIAPRLEGVAVADFYGTYLDARLKQACETLESSPSPASR